MPSATSNHHNSDNESESDSVDATDRIHYVSHSGDDVDELQGSDFPQYFHEREHRLFHSSPTSPYPLPVDGPEQERLNSFNILINQLIGAHYVGPVPTILADHPDRRPQVLDLCHGTGTWLMEIAGQFPWVLFTGIDIVPIATRYPRPNVQFEIGDITDELRWSDASFDFVHARSISWSARDYAAILPEVARIMRSGGLYLSGELETAVSFHPDSPLAENPGQPAPASTLFFQIVNDALQNLGIDPSVDEIADHLRNTGFFRDIESSAVSIPIGGWHTMTRLRDLGMRLRLIFERFADSVQPMLRDAGHEQTYIDQLIQNFVAEMDTTPEMVATYHIVQAVRSERVALSDEDEDGLETDFD